MAVSIDSKYKKERNRPEAFFLFYVSVQHLMPRVPVAVIRWCSGAPDPCPFYLSAGGPAAGGAAGQDQSVGGDREADLFRFDPSGIQRIEHGAEHIGQDGGLEACRIGIDKKEKGIFDRRREHRCRKGKMLSSIFQISPLGPLP